MLQTKPVIVGAESGNATTEMHAQNLGENSC
ncbi:hypothetical protein T4D_3713 [Trichinella pseudospiralis]|uniref:Uncharacterized protein n=1 Tax=Trichinella pseudospiralis TaxID=6337 RepID=A0A0V1DSJ3_TRIPS|nr:hypothetical protein T4D_3713 [Trichinella pseudospiralis]